MITCIVGEKGGTGKSTVATGLAAMLAANDRDTLLIDADTQLTTTKWQAIRAENPDLPQLACISLFGKTLAKEVRSLAPRYQDIIIDTGGRDTVEMRSALTVCDFAVLPFQPSQFDLWTVETMYTMLDQASAVNPDMKVMAVISQCETNLTTTDYLKAQEFIRDFPGMTLSTTPIRKRIAFKRAGQMGMNVIEFERNPLGKATLELKQLYQDIFE